MKKNRSKILMSIAVLAALVAAVGAVSAFALTQVHAKSPSAINFSNFSLPAGSDPWGTAFDSAGNVWVAAPGCDPNPMCAAGTAPGKLDVFNPHTGHWIKSISLPHGYGQPLFIAFDKSGQAWFTMPVTNTIGVYNPAKNTVSQFGLPTAGSGPWDLAVDHSGLIWITEHYSNKVAAFNPQTHRFHEIATPASNSSPYGITVDKFGNVWFTQNFDAVAAVDEIVFPSGALKVYKVRNGNTAGTLLTPHLITTDSQGNPWWSEGWVSEIGTLKVSAAKPGTNSGVTEFHYTPNGSSHTSGIGIDPSGRVWVTDSLQNTIGFFNGRSFTFRGVPGQHPHDGLNVDANGVVWFTEEFSNQLGRAN